MSLQIESIALVGGLVALVVPTVSAAVNIFRLLRTSGNHVIMRVDHREFVFDVSKLDRADVQSIDSAREAVVQKLESVG